METIMKDSQIMKLQDLADAYLELREAERQILALRETLSDNKLNVIRGGGFAPDTPTTVKATDGRLVTITRDDAYTDPRFEFVVSTLVEVE
jgi:hypothetical protein